MTAAVILGSSLCALAGTVSMSSPTNGGTVSSPIHVVATASSSYRITGTRIYVDGVSVYSGSSANIVADVPAKAGSRKLTTKVWDSSGASFSKTVYVTVGTSSSSSDTSTSTITIPSGATVYSRIEEMTGWGDCTDCAGGGENAIYSMTKNQSTPSLDGNSAKFWLGGSTPFSHGLWWRRMATNKTATNFVFDMYYRIDNPSKSQGLEFAANQHLSSGWYKWSTQCSFGSNMWRTWDSKNSRWVDTGIACTRPPANTWQHVVFEYKRYNGKAVFVSITVNGKKNYVNKSFYPRGDAGDGSIGIHYQMNGDRYQNDYTTWVDKMKLSVW